MTTRSAISIFAVAAFPSLALATITPGSLFGDSYIVRDGARDISVLDVYIQGGNAGDIVSSVFGASAHTAIFTMNQGAAFLHAGGSGSNNDWKPGASASAWDSFLTAGNRDQSSASSTLLLGLDNNWSAGTGAAIAGSGVGAGWYPGAGANTATNPYARVGLYNGLSGAINTAKANSNISGNGISVGQGLDNLFMVGRFAIEVTGLGASEARTMSLRFAIAGKQNGLTTFSGGSSAAGRFDSTLSFAVPAPGAFALLAIAGCIGRRRAGK